MLTFSEKKILWFNIRGKASETDVDKTLKNIYSYLPGYLPVYTIAATSFCSKNMKKLSACK